MATRVDGYIADSQDGVDWLEPFNAVDYGYERFIKEIRIVVLGRKTMNKREVLEQPGCLPENAALNFQKQVLKQVLLNQAQAQGFQRQGLSSRRPTDC